MCAHDVQLPPIRVHLEKKKRCLFILFTVVNGVINYLLRFFLFFVEQSQKYHETKKQKEGECAVSR